MIEITRISSGSSGNMYIVDDGQTKIVIECGLKFNDVQKGLKFSPTDYEACLISHEHSDHSLSAQKVAQMGIPCYMSNGTCKLLGLDPNINIKIMEEEKTYKIGTFKVTGFKMFHDASEPFGFYIESGNNTILYVTDTCFIKYYFHKLTHIMVECNYERSIMEDNIKTGLIPQYLGDRINRSHFELEDVKEFLKSNNLSKVQEIHLLHPSKHNLNHEKARLEIQELTGKPVYI